MLEYTTRTVMQNALAATLNEMATDGWEHYQTEHTGQGFTLFFCRPKQQPRIESKPNASIESATEEFKRQAANLKGS